MLANLALANERIWSSFEPPPNMLVSEWAEQNRILPPGTTAKPGLYVAERFQKGIMDAVCDPVVRDVTCKKSTQIGWTELLLNIVGYHIDVRPSPMMLVFVRDTDAEDKSKKTIQPMINECPSLAMKVRDNKSRQGGNTLLLKQFAGGFLKIAGANSAANLRSDPCVFVGADEVDGYPLDVDGEGDPLVLARRRTDSFPDDYKFLTGSTPAKPKGQSRIDSRYEESDQRMFYVPCPLCREMQPLLWRRDVDVAVDGKSKFEYNLTWDTDADRMPIPGTIRYRCRECRGLIEERHKQRMLNAGEWIAKFPERRTHAGFYINALYSPWGSVWDEMAKEWVKAKGQPELLRAFINLRLGETWDEGSVTVESSALEARRKDYFAPEGVDVPKGVGVLICTVDVQATRLEVQVKGFGAGEEEWLIDYEIFYGSPLEKPNAKGGEDLVNVWTELDAFLLKTWKHEGGADVRLALTLIDTGYATDACYDFIMPRQTSARRVYACKGQEKLAKPGLIMESKARRNTIRLFNVATIACKDRIIDRLRVNKPGPNYSHFPAWTTNDYFDQLTAESKVPVKTKRTGRVHYEWVSNQQRNEALDLTVYAHAGLWALQKLIAPAAYADLGALAAQYMAGTPAPTKPQPKYHVYSEGIA